MGVGLGEKKRKYKAFQPGKIPEGPDYCMGAGKVTGEFCR